MPLRARYVVLRFGVTDDARLLSCREGIRMFAALVAPIRCVLSALVATELMMQPTAGFALGLVIALMPNGNVIALSMCVLLFSLRCNDRLALEAVA
jgi:hypothetical protein